MNHCFWAWKGDAGARGPTLQALPLTQAHGPLRHMYVTDSQSKHSELDLLPSSCQHFPLPEGHLHLPHQPCKVITSRAHSTSLLQPPCPQVSGTALWAPRRLPFPGDQALFHPPLRFTSLSAATFTSASGLGHFSALLFPTCSQLFCRIHHHPSSPNTD